MYRTKSNNIACASFSPAKQNKKTKKRTRKELSGVYANFRLLKFTVQRERDRDREGETETETDRDRESERDRDRDRDRRESERQTNRHRQADRDSDSDRATDRQTETDQKNILLCRFSPTH